MARPKLEIPISKSEIIAVAVGLLAFVFIAVIFATSYAALPERVATHFGFDGQPDGWGNKSSFLWMLGVALLLFVGLLIMSRFPHTFNYPAELTEQNAPRLYLYGRQMMVVMAAEMAWLFALVFFASVRAAQGHGGLILPLTFGAVAVLMGSTVFMTQRMRNAAEGDE